MSRTLTPYAIGVASGVAVTSAFAAGVMNGTLSVRFTSASLFGNAVFFAGVAAILAVILSANLSPMEVDRDG